MRGFFFATIRHMNIVGIDEVGRGCWAGPLVAAAVVLHDTVLDVADSKKLSASKRQKLDALIRENSEVGLGWVSAQEVDVLGLTAAVRTAMARALEQITSYDTVIIDGNYNFLSHMPNTTAVIRADDSVMAVSAASIVAKVARDTYMQTTADQTFPLYGFSRHVGYGTALHAQRLKQFGPCLLHRMSYKPVQSWNLTA